MRSMFTFWAQAFDDVGPDHFFHQGQCVEEDNALERQSIVSKVTRIALDGKQYFDINHVKLIADSSFFVTELPMVERDLRGRISPIVCYGSCNLIKEDGFEESLCKEIDAFASSIGQGVAPQTLALVREAFRFLKKKRLQQRVARLATILVAAFSLLGIALWAHLRRF